MKVKTQIIEDTITEYLEHIRSTIPEQRDTLAKQATKTLAYSVVNQGNVYGRDEYGQFGLLFENDAPYDSGALLESGLNPRQQVLTREEHQSIVDLYWTGMYADYSWWEFREDSNTSKPPEVDYAYFQETGDKTGIPHSESRELKARHTGFFTRMVNDKGTQERIKHDIANDYLKLLLR